MADIVTKLDKSIGKYYKSKGINNYFNSNGDGKFLIWCGDFGYDEESLDDELGNDSTVEICECCDFDDNFPLKESVNKSDHRSERFKILQKYYLKVTASDNSPIPYLNAAEKIDQALALYYHSMNRHDYYNKHQKKGLFLRAFNDGDFDLDEIDEQLSNSIDINDCYYMDFELFNINTFPLHHCISIITAEDKRLTVFNILKYCHRHSIPPKHVSIIAEQSKKMMEGTDDLQFAFIRNETKLDEIMDRVAELYKIQCPTITKGMSMTDTDLELLLTVGYVNNVPMLQYFVDSYNRDRIKCVIENDTIEDLSVHDWVQSNEYIQCHLKKRYKDTTIVRSIEAAMNSYVKRIAPKLLLTPVVKIKDDLYKIAKYVMGASQFIDYILRKGQHLKHTKAPFQFDFVILLNECSALTPFENAKYESKIEFENDNDTSDSNYQFTDCIGMVPQRLESNHLIFSRDRRVTQKYSNKAPTSLGCMIEPFEEFVKKLEAKRGEKHMEKFPNFERFGAIVNRRRKITQTQHSTVKRNKRVDEIIFVELPKDCNNISHSHVAETQFDLLQKCVLPCINYESKESQTENINLQTMKCRADCNGGYLLFSFFVESWDEIKCYMFWMGQCLRFLPQDIIDILPRLFDTKYKMNGKFHVSDDLVKDIVSKVTFTDIYFNDWHRKMNAKQNRQDLEKYSHVYNSK